MHSCQLHVLVTGVNDSAFRLICETCTRSQRIKLAPEQAIFLFVNKGTLPPTVAALQEVCRHPHCAIPNEEDSREDIMAVCCAICHMASLHDRKRTVLWASGENTFGDPARCDTGGEVGARGAA
eukprot:4709042-Pleurochrysis_carterae.AAC.9